MLMIARRSAVDTRIETLNQLRHVVFTATPEIRAKFTGLTAIAVANKAAAPKPRRSDDDPLAASRLSRSVRVSSHVLSVRSPMVIGSTSSRGTSLAGLAIIWGSGCS
jgi:hypothetical protein